MICIRIFKKFPCKDNYPSLKKKIIVDYVFVGIQIHGNLQICIQVICGKFYMLVV
jgi:hypothetical protein